MEFLQLAEKRCSVRKYSSKPVEDEKLNSKEFKALWSKINTKSVYVVDFDTDELVKKSIDSLNSKLRVSKIFFKIESGAMDEIKSKEALTAGSSFVKEESGSYDISSTANSNVKYDLIGKLVDETGLTRKAIIQIMQGIDKNVFEQFKNNPEEFISKAAQLINDEKATAIVQHVTYDALASLSVTAIADFMLFSISAFVSLNLSVLSTSTIIELKT